MVDDDILNLVSGGLVDLRADVDAGEADRVALQQGGLYLHHHLHVQVLAGRVLQGGARGGGGDGRGVSAVGKMAARRTKWLTCFID